MRRSFAFLQDNYKRLSNPQKVSFSNAIIEKYLSSIENLPNTKVVDRYSPLKIIEKLQQFDLMIANLFSLIENTSQKALKILLIKLASHALKTNGIDHL